MKVVTVLLVKVDCKWMDALELFFFFPETSIFAAIKILDFALRGECLLLNR